MKFTLPGQSKARSGWAGVLYLLLGVLTIPLLVAASATGPSGAAVVARVVAAAPEPLRKPPRVAPAPKPTPVPSTGHENDPGLWLSWAVLDRTSGAVTGSPDRATARTNAESSIKAWIAADRLRVNAATGRPLSAADRDRIERAVRSSDDDAAEQLYRGLGGSTVLRDLGTVCGVPVTTSRAGYWSYAQITAQDAVRTLDCVLDRAPTYPEGQVLVDALHGVDRADAFGIPAALPPGTAVAVKNGWTEHSATGLWNVDCVASWGDRVMAVMTRYPAARGLDYGAGVCRDTAAAYLATQASTGS